MSFNLISYMWLRFFFWKIKIILIRYNWITSNVDLLAKFCFTTDIYTRTITLVNEKDHRKEENSLTSTTSNFFKRNATEKKALTVVSTKYTQWLCCWDVAKMKQKEEYFHQVFIGILNGNMMWIIFIWRGGKTTVE